MSYLLLVLQRLGLFVFLAFVLAMVPFGLIWTVAHLLVRPTRKESRS